MMRAPRPVKRVKPFSVIAAAANSKATFFSVLTLALTTGVPVKVTLSSHWCPTRKDGATNHFSANRWSRHIKAKSCVSLFNGKAPFVFDGFEISPAVEENQPVPVSLQCFEGKIPPRPPLEKEGNGDATSPLYKGGLGGILGKQMKSVRRRGSTLVHVIEELPVCC
jgi:hypothetical protein